MRKQSMAPRGPAISSTPGGGALNDIWGGGAYRKYRDPCILIKGTPSNHSNYRSKKGAVNELGRMAKKENVGGKGGGEGGTNDVFFDEEANKGNLCLASGPPQRKGRPKGTLRAKRESEICSFSARFLKARNGQRQGSGQVDCGRKTKIN